MLLVMFCSKYLSLLDYQYIVPSVKVWLEFLRKRGYLWSYCVGLERVIAHSHTWWVLRTWRMLDWMIQKKKCHSPFNCSLMKPAFFFLFLFLLFFFHLLQSHLSALINPTWHVFDRALPEFKPPMDDFIRTWVDVIMSHWVFDTPE